MTPCHSIFRELYIRRDGPAVTLLWVARHRRCFELYGATLRAAADDEAFRLALYVDGEKPRDAWGETDVHQGIPFTHGRPDVSRAVADLAACSSPYVFVCGPPAMYESLCGPRDDPELTGILRDLGYSKDQVIKF